MLSFHVALVASAVTLASAQTLAGQQPFGGFGRFPCETDGLSDQALCADAAIVARNPVAIPAQPTTEKSSYALPTGSTCFAQPSTGKFFCGIAGAPCTTDANCDVGSCSAGICTGGLGQSCAGDDSNCLGLLACLDGTGAGCGGVGAYCADISLDDGTYTPLELYNIYSQFCSVNSYCDIAPGAPLECTASAALGETCVAGVDASCNAGLECPTGVCQRILGPSPRARQRRALNQPISSLCPASQSACVVSGTKGGFECIDTNSNLEQCGACAIAGGVDCTTLPGVDAVGCIAGQCEVWSCATGYEWDAASSACKA